MPRSLAELTRREGVHLTENDLREKGLRPRRKARSEVETAVELEELPKTSEGLRDGEIPYENARILAKASQEGDIDETDLVDKARTQSPDKFAGTVRKYQQATLRRRWDVAPGASAVTEVRQDPHRPHRRHDRFVRSVRPDHRRSHRDGVVGEDERTVAGGRPPCARCSPGQRMADALAGLVTREDTDQKTGKPPRGPRLLLIADYDVIEKELQKRASW